MFTRRFRKEVGILTMSGSYSDMQKVKAACQRQLDDLKRQRASGLTFAPEAGSQRLRDVINKNVTEAQLVQTAERVFGRGWSKIKLERALY